MLCWLFDHNHREAKPTKRSFKGKGVGGFRGIVRKISMMVRMGSNPHHSWLGLTEQQNLTLFRGRARVMAIFEG